MIHLQTKQKQKDITYYVFDEDDHTTKVYEKKLEVKLPRTGCQNIFWRVQIELSFLKKERIDNMKNIKLEQMEELDAKIEKINYDLSGLESRKKEMENSKFDNNKTQKNQKKKKEQYQPKQIK